MTLPFGKSTPVVCLVDTGSNATLVDTETYLRLPESKVLTQAPMLVTADGSPLATLGCINSTIAGSPTTIIVSPDLKGSCILGCNFLKSEDMLGPSGLTIKGTYYPYSPERLSGPQTHAVSTLQVPESIEPALQAVLHEYRDVFAQTNTPLKLSKLPPADIVTTGDPFKQKLRRAPFSLRHVISDEIDKMLKDGIIQPSTSPYASNVVIVKKPDGSYRFCIDYRELNNQTIKDSFPIPNTQDIFDNLGEATLFSTLDMKSGYWQVALTDESRPTTAFTSFKGLYEFAPGIFQREVQKVL